MVTMFAWEVLFLVNVQHSRIFLFVKDVGGKKICLFYFIPFCLHAEGNMTEWISIIVILSLHSNFTVIVSPQLSLIVIIIHLINYCSPLMSNSQLLIVPGGQDSNLISNFQTKPRGIRQFPTFPLPFLMFFVVKDNPGDESVMPARYKLNITSSFITMT